MIAKDKAKEMVGDYSAYAWVGYSENECRDNAIKCALIDVVRILSVLKGLKSTVEILGEYRFWFEVKIELEKLV